LNLVTQLVERRQGQLGHRETVEFRAGWRCEYCRAPQPATGIRYHLDHIIPESLGGTDELDNLALACPTCHYYKSNHLLGMNQQGLDDQPLFNPSSHRWDEHFEFNQNTLMQGEDGPGKRDDRQAPNE